MIWRACFAGVPATPAARIRSICCATSSRRRRSVSIGGRSSFIPKTSRTVRAQRRRRMPPVRRRNNNSNSSNWRSPWLHRPRPVCPPRRRRAHRPRLRRLRRRRRRPHCCPVTMMVQHQRSVPCKVNRLCRNLSHSLLVGLRVNVQLSLDVYTSNSLPIDVVRNVLNSVFVISYYILHYMICWNAARSPLQSECSQYTYIFYTIFYLLLYYIYSSCIPHSIRDSTQGICSRLVLFYYFFSLYFRIISWFVLLYKYIHLNVICRLVFGTKETHV